MTSCGSWEPQGPSCLAVGSLPAGLLALDGSWGPWGPWEPWGRRARSGTLRRGRGDGAHLRRSREAGGGARGLSR